MSQAAEAEALRRLGAQKKVAGELDAAERALREALRLEPGSPHAKVLLAEVLLSQGRYAEAWPLSEVRLDVGPLGSPRPPLDEPEWMGEPIAGKRLLIVGEQGMGDQIMYARYAPILKSQGVEVSLLCLPPLARLFALSLGVSVHPMAGRVEMPDPDCWVMAASLPARFGTTPETIPKPPYLFAPPRPTGARIGVMTRGNPRHAHDAWRSLPEEIARRLVSRPGVTSLAPEATGATDFFDTAQIVAGLDLVISVDTSVAHLAGALGKPVWILLPARGVDWRWMERREDSPWYPSARLFRQAQVGGWAPVMDDVETALAAQGL